MQGESTSTYGQALHRRIAAGETAVGVSVRLGCAPIAEELAGAGFDYLYIDQQHGFVSRDALVDMLRATARTDTTVIVRVPANDEALIGFALDVGADGVLVPSIGSPEEAARAVAACRYAPEGTRSWGRLRGSSGGSGDASREILCFPLIEDVAGVAAVEDIAHVDGISGLWVGPADLALTMNIRPVVGLIPGPHTEAVERIVEACDAVDIPAAISGDPVAMSAKGFRLVTAGSDSGFLSAGIAKVRAAADALKAAADGSVGEEVAS